VSEIWILAWGRGPGINWIPQFEAIHVKSDASHDADLGRTERKKCRDIRGKVVMAQGWALILLSNSKSVDADIVRYILNLQSP